MHKNSMTLMLAALVCGGGVASCSDKESVVVSVDSPPPDTAPPVEETPSCAGTPLSGYVDVNDADEIYYGTEDGAEFGSELGGVGDQDYDSKDDLLIGAPEEDGGLGAVYLQRSADGRPLRLAGLTEDHEADANDAPPQLGLKIAEALPGAPPCEPLVFAARYLNANGTDSGAVFFIDGCPTEDVDVSRLRGGSFMLAGDGVDHYRGQDLVSGDLNGDDERDILVLNPTGSGYDAELLIGGRSEDEAWRVARTLTFDAEHRHIRRAAFMELPGDGGGSLVIADDYADVDGHHNNGQAWLLRYGDLGMSTSAWGAALSLSDDLDGGRFGQAVGAGDFNGDGAQDLIVGALASGTGTAGAAFLFSGDTLQESLGQEDVLWAYDGAVDFRGQLPDENFGMRVDMGDINNDGLDDLLVASSNSNSDDTEETFAYVIMGSETPARRDLSTQNADLWFSGIGETGQVIKSVGDRNGDGCVDFAVAAPHLDVDGLNRAGAVYVFYGWSDAP